MRRFEFNLQGILNLRNFEEENRKRELGLEVAKKSKMIDELNQMAEEKKQLLSTQSQIGITDSREYMHYILFHQKLEQDVQNQYRAISTQEGVISQKTELLHKAVLERKKMDKLKERRLAEYRKESLKKDAKVMDEVSSRIFRAGQG